MPTRSTGQPGYRHRDLLDAPSRRHFERRANDDAGARLRRYERHAVAIESEPFARLEHDVALVPILCDPDRADRHEHQQPPAVVYPQPAAASKADIFSDDPLIERFLPGTSVHGVLRALQSCAGKSRHTKERSGPTYRDDFATGADRYRLYPSMFRLFGERCRISWEQSSSRRVVRQCLDFIGMDLRAGACRTLLIGNSIDHPTVCPYIRLREHDAQQGNQEESDMAAPPKFFTDGEAYERLMGRWSRAAGEVFIEWLSLRPGLEWLDVGCGTGAFSEMILSRCSPKRICGIDPAEDQIAFARSRPLAPHVDYRIGDAQSLPFGDAEFDVAAMALVITFVPDPAKAVLEMARVVKPGGSVATYISSARALANSRYEKLLRRWA